MRHSSASLSTIGTRAASYAQRFIGQVHGGLPEGDVVSDGLALLPGVEVPGETKKEPEEHLVPKP